MASRSPRIAGRFAAGLRSPLLQVVRGRRRGAGRGPTDTTRLGAGRGPTDTDTESYARPTIYLVFLNAAPPRDDTWRLKNEWTPPVRCPSVVGATRGCCAPVETRACLVCIIEILEWGLTINSQASRTVRSLGKGCFLSPKPYPHKCAETGARTRDLPITDGRLGKGCFLSSLM